MLHEHGVQGLGFRESVANQHQCCGRLQLFGEAFREA